MGLFDTGAIVTSTATIQIQADLHLVNSVPRFENAWMQRSKFPYTVRWLRTCRLPLSRLILNALGEELCQSYTTCCQH